MKLQIYFENEFNEHLNIIKTKKINNFKTENKKTKFNKQSPRSIKSKENKKIINKMFWAKEKHESLLKNHQLSKIEIDFDSIGNKTINELAIDLPKSKAISLSIIRKKSKKYRYANENTIINEEIWHYIQYYVKNAYELKIRREKVEKSISFGPIYNRYKKTEKFKPSLGMPGNYAKLIFIGAKT